MTAFGHLRRKSARTLQLFQFHATSARKALRVFSRDESSFVPKRVLIVAKLSRYHYEKLREPGLDEGRLKLKLLERGSDYDSLLASHTATKEVQKEVTQVLARMNVEFKIVDRKKLDLSHFDWADLILPIGGDGTFLLASNMIHDDRKPIMGINSFPERSEGFLMLPKKYTKSIPEIFEMLRAGHYSTVMRRRIRTTLKGDDIWSPPFHMHEKGRVAGGDKFYVHEGGKADSAGKLPRERRLPWLALNEVFMAETLTARTSSLLLKLEDKDNYHRIKCSGLCVSTGTGSTSWYRTINSVSPRTVQDILRLANCEKRYTDEEVRNICNSFNNSLQFDAEDLKLSYAVRDMIVTDVWPVPKCVCQRGICTKITVRSQCYDAGLVIDGGIAVPFNFGTKAVLETLPEDSLRNLALP